MSTSRTEVKLAIHEMIRQQLQLEMNTPLAEDAHFFTDLGGDSLDLAEVGMEIEDHFSIDLPDDDKVARIGEIVDLVMGCLENAPCQ